MKQWKRRLAVLVALVLMVSAMPLNAQAAAKKGTVKTVTITNPSTKTLVLKKGQKFKLKTKVVTTGKASKKVTFWSSNKSIVKVSSKGTVKALKKGKAWITVRSVANKKKKASIKVIVGSPVTKVKLNKTSLKLTEGKTTTLKATLSPKKPSVKKVSFTSSNSKVAKVNSKGKVTAVKAGKANITVKAMDGSGKKAVCKVTVVKKKPTTEKPTTEKPTTEKPTTEKPTTEKPTTEEPTTEEPGLSYDGYELKWQDDFESGALNRDDWNVELHEPGWVNQEWQEYVDSEENVYIEDGNLVLKPVQKIVDGETVYTSGRVNTQGKHDFTYGLFEVRAKVPTGTGYLPAFWMMPTDENLYGQWPRCGEIDIMEVMGQENDKVYGTIHYGEPHAESQGTKKLAQGNFSDEYHTFSCEWQPGSIKWYVDGVLYHEENDWFSATEGQGTVSYPAPFDQPFYMILNLAVGGSWVGYPDEDTDFENQKFVIDYVRAYQKTEGYDDTNVTKPEKPPVTLREPDANGNYVNNSDFLTVEDLTDETDWQFMTALGGEATAAIVQNSQMGSAIKIETTDKGTVDYSVQLVQHKVPLKQGAKYKLIFNAYAEEARTMYAGIGTIGDRSWKKYVNSEINLTTEKQTYICEFNMSDEDYENARIEFNMGNIEPQSTIYISNVKLEQMGEFEIDDSKTVRADGNYVYNGSFQEGTNRMEYWEITDAGTKADVSVTGINDGRRLKVISSGCDNANEVLLKQTELPITSGKYELSFEAELAEPAVGDTVELAVCVAGGRETFTLNKDEKKLYTYKFEIADDVVITDIDDIVFEFGVNGTVLMDNIRLVEDTLIKNGSFNAGTSGYDIYVENSASASYVVDSQSEDNALDLTIKKSGDAEWKIQVKQNNVKLEKDKCYELKFDIKSSLARPIQYAIQRDGSMHKTESGAEDWTPYVQETIPLTEYGSNGAYTTVSKKFKMTFDTDEGSIFNIALGGNNLTTQHRICIDNISLTEIDESEMPFIPAIEAGVEMLDNIDFSNDGDGWEKAITSPGAANVTFADGKAVYAITNVGDEDWNVQLKQSGITLEKGSEYKAAFKVKSDVARTIKLAFLDASYNWYGGADITLTANEEKLVECTFVVSQDTSDEITMVVSMGQIYNGEGTDRELVNTPVSTITMSDFSLKKLETQEVADGENILKNADFSDADDSMAGWTETIANWDGLTASAVRSIAEGVITYAIENVGTEDWHIQLKQSGLSLEEGGKYKVAFTISSTKARSVKSGVMSTEYTWYGGNTVALAANQTKQVEYEFTMDANDSTADFFISMGQLADDEGNAIDTPASTIKISNISITKVVE
ncbi:MAG: carbohydrate binding domain-containing protein [Clostridium sp.]|nr:carbohydrate binding domain-containing protein [Clostridium sp.]MCM1399117.1 carbohydrate binding domain-containing protein [Clostridium sp.]MCM1459509.1 carbohydrate binding domain-containing protein [Bacteroides sp.]